MKNIKILAIVIAVLAILAIIILAYFGNSHKKSNQNKPPVVDYFACGDYCPGPPEQYTIKVYQGVEDEKQCLALGGKPGSFTGWTTRKYCQYLTK